MEETQTRPRWVVVLFVIAYSLLVFFAVGEVATRAFHLLDRLSGTPRRLYQATDVRGLPYRLRPGVELQLGEARVAINQLGLRGADAEAVPAAGIERVLVIGDSIVFGQGLDGDATFPVQLERELRSRGLAVEVLNGGVPGYNPAAELVFLRTYGLELAPSRIILGISLNDFGVTPFVTQSGLLTTRRSQARDPDRWLPVSEFWLLLRWISEYGAGTHWYQASTQDTDKDLESAAEDLISRNHRRFYESPNPARWRGVSKALTGIRDLCRERGLPLSLVIFPEKYQREQADTEPQRRWLELCDQLELECIDLWPSFHATGGELYLGAQHHTAAGHALAARVVAQSLWPDGQPPGSPDLAENQAETQ